MPLATLEIEDELATVALDRSDKRNALSQELIEQTREHLDEAADAGVRALLLVGEGPVFCAGGDVAWMEQRLGKPEATRAALEEHVGPLVEQVDTFPAPTVSAVQGAAIGAGLGLALATDLTIAEADATLGATHARLGLTPDGGTSWFLARALGPKRALDLVLRARTFTGREAAAWGLVTETAPMEELFDLARTRARVLAQGPTQAYRTARQLLRDATRTSLSEMLELEAAAQGAMYRTEDQKEGVRAFLEDREPEFEGR